MDYGQLIEQLEARNAQLKEAVTVAEAEVAERKNLLEQMEAEATQLRREKMAVEASLREMRRLAEVVAPAPPVKNQDEAKEEPETSDGNESISPDALKKLLEDLARQQDEMDKQTKRGGLKPWWPYPDPIGPSIPRHPWVSPQHPYFQPYYIGDLPPNYIGDPLPYHGPTCGGFVKVRGTLDSLNSLNVHLIPWQSEQKS